MTASLNINANQLTIHIFNVYVVIFKKTSQCIIYKKFSDNLKYYFSLGLRVSG